MKKIILLLCVLLFLSACSPDNTDRSPADEPLESYSEVTQAVEIINDVYIPDHSLTMEETIEQFFEQQYNAYTSLQYIDITYLLDMDQSRNHNPLIWLESLIQRRSLIAQNEFCYVERTKYPYRITYEEKAKDGRMEFWSSRGLQNEDEEIVHFTITGEKERAYPPFLAMNGQHTMRLKQIDDVWKITSHYYPGSSRYRTKTPLVLLSEEEMLADLRKEFKAISPNTLSGETNVPAVGFPYKGARAVEYAKTYTESPNLVFYDINDWLGNCSNFTSQSIWYGFGNNDRANVARRENMTSQWYAGQGGGSPAWENVEQFWDYATKSRGPQESGVHGEVVETIFELDIGGIIQTRSGRFRNTDGKYNHSLLLVEKSTLLLAQNTPDCFIYYSDLADIDSRFFNPQYLIE